MGRDQSNELGFPQAAFRWLAVAAFGIGFLAIASVIDPSSSQAVSSLGREDAARANGPAGKSLGVFEGRSFTMQAHTGPEGPSYSLLDPAGNVIVSQVSVDELASFLEGYDPASMRAEGAIGIVDDDIDFDH